MKPAPAIEEDEAKPFKANPIRKTKAPKPVAPSTKAPTEPEPFNMPGERIHEQQKAEWQRKMAEDEVRERAAHNFKAGPIQHHATTPCSMRAHIQPKVTEPEPFKLVGDSRMQAS